MVNKKTFAKIFNRYGSFITGFNLPLEDSVQDKQTNVPTEVGINKEIRDEKGEVVERVRKASGSDTTVILKKEEDGKMYRLVKTPMKQGDCYTLEQNPVTKKWELDSPIRYRPTP